MSALKRRRPVKAIDPEQELDINEAAEYLGLASAQVLRNYLSQGRGPARTKIFNKNFFKIRDLDKWVDENVEYIPAYSTAAKPAEDDGEDPEPVRAGAKAKKPGPPQKKKAGRMLASSELEVEGRGAKVRATRIREPD